MFKNYFKKKETIMSEKCEQGDAIERQLSEDKLESVKNIGELITEVKLLEQSITTLVGTSVKKLEECGDDRGWLHRRINKIWATIGGSLFIAVGWFIVDHLSDH